MLVRQIMIICNGRQQITALRPRVILLSTNQDLIMQISHIAYGYLHIPVRQLLVCCYHGNPARNSAR